MGLNEIFNKIEMAFEKSDVKKLAEEKGKEWFYSLCKSKPRKGQPLIIGLNWGAKSEKFQPQDINNLPESTKWNEMGKLSQIKDYLKGCFPLLPLGNFNQTNLCFFRSQKESQLTQYDINLCKPIFEEFIELLKPQIMFGFSAPLRNYLILNNRIEYLNEKILHNGESRIFLKQGFIKFGNWWTYINLLPHPNNWRYEERGKVLKKIWEFARQTYPYEYQLTDFLNFLESRGLHPTLSKNPIEGKDMREMLLKENAINFPNLNLFRFKTILPERFDTDDITTLNRYIIQNGLDTKKIEKEFREYLTQKKKNNNDMSKIINDWFDEDLFYNSLAVTKMSLQRFFIANKFPIEYFEYKKLNTEKNVDFWEPIMN